MYVEVKVEDLATVFLIALYMLYGYLGIGVFFATAVMLHIMRPNGRIRWNDFDLIDPYFRVKVYCILIIKWWWYLS